MTQLSAHFTLEELAASEVALRKGLDNTPDAETIEHLKVLAAALEEVRTLLDLSLIVHSAYRSPQVNAATGGSSNPPSVHMAGYAADFVAPDFGTPVEICRAIRDSGIKFDQVIAEGNWVHFAVDPRMRQMVLTAHFAEGKVSYTEGLA
jgi:zinc D-Ala-D-Ala carboxypeptidase